MSPALARLRQLHDKAKHFDLAPGEGAVYAQACQELSRAILAAQEMRRMPGQKPRSALRVSQALKLEIAPSTAEHFASTLTLDLSTAGFAALLPEPLQLGERVVFVMHARPEAIQGDAVVVGCVPQRGAYRASFAIASLPPSAAERLRIIVIDAALARLPS